MGEWRIVRCPACKLVYVGNPPSAQELGALYDEAYWESTDSPGYGGYAAEGDRKRHHFRTLLDRIETIREGRGALFEVGCAYGFFLDEARRRGWAVSGVEPSRPAAGHAREALGLDVFEGDLEGARVPAESQDVVAMWDVIEHLPDPLTTLRSVRRILRPTGILALSTGDVDSLSARIQGGKWSLFTPPFHLFYFSRRTLVDMVTRAGFAVVRVDGDGVVAADPQARESRLPRWLVRLLTGPLTTAAGRRLGAGMVKYLYAKRVEDEGVLTLRKERRHEAS